MPGGRKLLGRERAARAMRKRNREAYKAKRAEREREAAEVAAWVEAREQAARARRTAEWKSRPWPTVSARDVDWEALSQSSAEALTMIALPLALGLTQPEVAEQAGLTRPEVARRMRNLREELLAQVAARRAKPHSQRGVGRDGT